VAPVSKIDYELVRMGLWGLVNLVTLIAAELDDTPLHLMDIH
jgi:hypothetical protein